MKLPCPYCTESITYDHNLAGKTIKCTYCQKNILMTPLDKLPPDYRQEYLSEQDIIRKNEEQKQKLEEVKAQKLKEQQKREAEWVAAAESERQEAKKQQKIKQALENIDKQQEMKEQEWNCKISEMKKIITEEELIETKIYGNATDKSYPILIMYASIYRAAGIILIILGIISFIIGMNQTNQVGSGALIVGIFTALMLLIGAISLFAISEGIYLAVNVADDLRVSKTLLKWIAYTSKDPNHQPNVEIPPSSEIQKSNKQ